MKSFRSYQLARSLYDTNFNVEGGESFFIRRLQISAACEAVNAPSSHANGQPARPV